MTARLRTILLLLSALASVLLASGARGEDARETIVTAARLEQAKDAVRLDLELDGAAEPRIVLMRHPYRIALDFDRTLSAAKLPVLRDKALVTDIRHGLAGPERYRIVLTLAGPAVPTLGREATANGARFSLGLRPAKDEDFVAPVTTGATAKAPAPVGAGTGKPFLVVLDPGHGGVDRGATGEGGTDEKTVNLAFGLALRDALLRLPGVEVVMTRTDDTFIPLAERSAIARRAGADLLLSLHADSIRFPDLRGATVYTLSDNASDQLSRELAETENAADRFAGPEWEGDVPEIHDILVDLVRRETETFSDRFATELVVQMREGEIRLINNPKRSAGFRVLRAPDVPSVLLEMGYISNKDEERQLLTAEWQQKLAGIVAGAIGDFAGERREAGR